VYCCSSYAGTNTVLF
nr:immunoglobulin light chain junction region [Macaca mulatta]